MASGGAGAAAAADAAAVPTATSPSGSMQVTVPDATMAEFKALKTRRKYRYMTLKINSDTFELEVDKTGLPSATGAQFLKALPATQARYCVFDFEYKTRDGRKADKLFFILWTPAGAVGRDNMLYASQRRALDTAISGVDDKQCSSTAAVAKLLEIKEAMEDEDSDWDPDA